MAASGKERSNGEQGTPLGCCRLWVAGYLVALGAQLVVVSGL